MSTASGQLLTAAPDNAVRVSVLASGKVLLNGNPADFAAIAIELKQLKATGGTVWYYRENAESEPPPVAMSIIELITSNRLSLTMSTKPDFSDYVDSDGRVHVRER